jgi:hypothetical protein
VGWIVENRQIPGHASYVDAQFMKDRKRFFVVADFLPETITLSNDPRVTRIKGSEWLEILHENGYNGNDYLLLGLQEKTEDDDKIVIIFANLFDRIAAHGYEFIFTIRNGEIEARSKLKWVS